MRLFSASCEAEQATLTLSLGLPPPLSGASPRAAPPIPACVTEIPAFQCPSLSNQSYTPVHFFLH